MLDQNTNVLCKNELYFAATEAIQFNIYSIKYS